MAGRYLSIKAAVDALSVTPSAISQRIRDLEHYLGQPVFVRKTGAVDLTDSGRALLEEIEPLLGALDAALDRAGKWSRRRVLRIAALPFVATDLLIPRLGSFYGMQPRVDLELNGATPRLDAHTTRADVSILICPTPPAQQVATRLLEPRFVTATSQPLASVARELGPRAFDERRRIVYGHRADLWSKWFAMTGYPVARNASVLHLDTPLAAASAAERGFGVALVPTSVCERRLRSRRLARISDSEVESGDAYYLGCRAEDRSRSEVRAFLSWALTELRR